MKEIKCPICGNQMSLGEKEIVLTHENEKFHTIAMVYSCEVCGYSKIGTCDIHITMDDEIQNSDTETGKEKTDDIESKDASQEEKDQDENENKSEDKVSNDKEAEGLFTKKNTCDESNDDQPQPEEKCEPEPKIPILEKRNGKITVSDEWLDIMLEKYKWFKSIYNYAVSYERRQLRYLDKHKPFYKAITNDTLYDTDKSFLFFTKDIRDGKKIKRKYYYDTGTNKYFCITASLGMNDEMDTISMKEVKRLLKNEPDIYLKVIPDAVNMPEKYTVENKKEKTKAEEAETTSERSAHENDDPNPNNRKPIT